MKKHASKTQTVTATAKAAKTTTTTTKAAKAEKANVFTVAVELVKITLCALGSYCFSRGVKPVFAFSEPMPASKRKGLLVLLLGTPNEGKGGIARGVYRDGDKLALAHCPSTGSENVIFRLAKAPAELPTVTITGKGAQVITEQDFLRESVLCTVERNGTNVMADLYRYDDKLVAPDYIPCRWHDVSGRKVYGQLERKLIAGKNEAELGKKVVIVRPSLKAAKAVKIAKAKAAKVATPATPAKAAKTRFDSVQIPVADEIAKHIKRIRASKTVNV